MRYSIRQAMDILLGKGFDETDLNIVFGFYPNEPDGKYSELDLWVIEDMLPL